MERKVRAWRHLESFIFPTPAVVLILVSSSDFRRQFVRLSYGDISLSPVLDALFYPLYFAVVTSALKII